MTGEPNDPAAAVVLAPVLDLAGAEALSRSLKARLADGALLIDGDAVERVSTPCLQVLAAAAVAARERQVPFRLRRPSAALVAAVADLGLNDTIAFEV